jgi:hypothetical protein
MPQPLARFFDLCISIMKPGGPSNKFSLELAGQVIHREQNSRNHHPDAHTHDNHD